MGAFVQPEVVPVLAHAGGGLIGQGGFQCRADVVEPDARLVAEKVFQGEQGFR